MLPSSADLVYARVPEDLARRGLPDVVVLLEGAELILEILQSP